MDHNVKDAILALNEWLKNQMEKCSIPSNAPAIMDEYQTRMAEIVQTASQGNSWAGAVEDITFMLYAGAIANILLQKTTDGANQVIKVVNQASGVINSQVEVINSRVERGKKNSKKATDAKYSRPGGSREKQENIRKIWASGKYTSRDICAEQECAGLDMSYSVARKALRKTPDPT